MATPFNSILHPTDFSPLSDLAFKHALALAIKAQADFTICHVMPDRRREIDWKAFPSVRSILEQWGYLPPGSKQADVAAQLGIKVEKTSVISRSPVGPIVATVDRFAADFLVLASQGREGLPRWLQASVAEPVARISRVKTLFVSGNCKGFVKDHTGEISIRRILVPIDYHPNAAAAMQTAIQLAEINGNPESVEIIALHIGKALLPEPFIPTTANVLWRTEPAQGDVATTLIDKAATTASDLIIMATAGHQGFIDAIRGSTTEQVLRRAPCPVLAVPLT